MTDVNKEIIRKSDGAVWDGFCGFWCIGHRWRFHKKSIKHWLNYCFADYKDSHTFSNEVEWKVPE